MVCFGGSMKKKILLVLLTFLFVGLGFAQEKILDANSGVFLYLKGSNTKLTEEDYLVYAQEFHSETYRKYSNDEFEWHDQFNIIKQKLDEEIANADFDSTYVVVTSVDLEDYDFTNEGFPVSIGEGTFIPLGRNDGYKSFKSIFYNRTALGLHNFHRYNFFKFAKDDAKAFLQGRKNSRGEVNRKVTLQITYKIASYDSSEYKSFANWALSNKYLPVVGIIQSIEVYDAANKNKVKKIGELIIQ